MRLLFLAAAALAACAHARADPAVPEAARRELLEADAAFARATAERGVEGWVSFFADDGEMFPARSPPVRGPAAIRDLMADLGDPRKGPPALRLTWQPARAVVSASGDLGYTVGSSLAQSERGDRRGKYVTIWRKQADGSWKVVLDIGNEGPLSP